MIFGSLGKRKTKTSRLQMCDQEEATITHIQKRVSRIIETTVTKKCSLQAQVQLWRIQPSLSGSLGTENRSSGLHGKSCSGFQTRMIQCMQRLHTERDKTVVLPCTANSKPVGCDHRTSNAHHHKDSRLFRTSETLNSQVAQTASSSQQTSPVCTVEGADL